MAKRSILLIKKSAHQNNFSIVATLLHPDYLFPSLVAIFFISFQWVTSCRFLFLIMYTWGKFNIFLSKKKSTILMTCTNIQTVLCPTSLVPIPRIRSLPPQPHASAKSTASSCARGSSLRKRENLITRGRLSLTQTTFCTGPSCTSYKLEIFCEPGGFHQRLVFERLRFASFHIPGPNPIVERGNRHKFLTFWSIFPSFHYHCSVQYLAHADAWTWRRKFNPLWRECWRQFSSTEVSLCHCLAWCVSLHNSI